MRGGPKLLLTGRGSWPAAWALLALALSAMLVPAVAGARTHALLVGVSGYPSLGKKYQLAGPANDVELYRQLLLEHGAAAGNVHVLADGIKGGSLPTRAAILQAFQSLAREVKPNDLVLVLIAGHGSQQPAAPDTGEPDGLDEIFLPRDVGRWQREIGSVANAITDNELGVALQSLRARGALVWAIFDTCHAGTLARAIPLVAQRDRYVPPEMLGIDTALLTAAQSRAAISSVSTRSVASERRVARDSTAASAVGDYVYLYASQSQETTPELHLPAYAPLSQVHGLFAYTLYRVLSAGLDLSYRQAVERVLHVYSSQGRQAPSPLYEGSALDAPIFGDARSSRPLQWRVERQGNLLQLQAGELQGIGRDSVLAVVSSPLAGPNQVLGHVRVIRATLSSATLVPVPYAGRPALAARRMPRDAYARPVDVKVDFRLRVGIAQAGADCDVPRRDLRAAMVGLRQDARRSARLLWPSPSQAADVYLCQRGAQVLLLDAAGGMQDQLRTTPGIALPNSSALSTEVLATALQRQLAVAAHAVNLSRVVAAHSRPAQVEVTLERRARCAGVVVCTSTPLSLTSELHAELCEGDRVSVELSNPQFEPVDVTILYIDAAYGVTTLYPDAAGETSRFDPKGKHHFDIQIDAKSSGLERLLVLTAQATPQSPNVSFAGLAQPGLPTFQRGNDQGLLDLWQQAAFVSNPLTASRGAGAQAAGLIGATTYAWTVAPRDSRTSSCGAAQGPS